MDNMKHYNKMQWVYVLFCIQAVHVGRAIAGCTGGDWACPEKCNCTNGSDISVDCYDAGYTTAPPIFPRNSVHINLMKNKIDTLDSSSFKGCSKLFSLKLAKNNISQIHNGTFDHLDQLNSLWLFRNPINLMDQSSFPAGILDGLASLQYLSLDKLSKSTEYNRDIILHKPKLKFLAIDGIEGASFPDTYNQLRKLEILHIYGDIRTLTNTTLQVFQHSSVWMFRIRAMKLSRIEPMAFSCLPNLVRLEIKYCMYLNFSEQTANSLYSLKYTQIKSLTLSRITPHPSMYPVKVDSGFFKYCSESYITDLDLGMNGIYDIDMTHWSEHLTHLTKLKMQYNRFYKNIVNIINYSPNLANLTTLDLRYQSKYPNVPDSQFHELEDDETILDGIFTKLQSRKDHTLTYELSPNLKNLLLSVTFEWGFEHLRNISIYNGSSNFTVLDLSFNHISSLYGPLTFKPSIPRSINLLNFSGCGICYISSYFLQFPLKIDTWDLSHNNLGDFLSEVKNGTFLKQSNEVDLKTLNLSSCGIKYLHPDFFSEVSSLTTLYLGDNAIHTWAASLRYLPNLQFLDLSHNSIYTLSDETMEEIKSIVKQPENTFLLDLSANPLDADCYNLHFLKWLLNTDINLINKDKYQILIKSEPHTFKELEKITQNLDIICSSKAWAIATACMTAVFMILIFLSVIIYRHRWDMRYFCLHLIRMRKEAQIDETVYVYDAFVAYHNEDFPWVRHELMRQLEDHASGSLLLCVHQRDWLPGPTIEENISQSVETSRKTIIVLSRQFLHSSWCEFEMQIARIRGIEVGKEVIIVVALEEIPLGEMNRTLVNLRKTNTWLQWPEAEEDRTLFWKKLRAAVRHPKSGPTRCACGRPLYTIQDDDAYGLSNSSST